MARKQRSGLRQQILYDLKKKKPKTKTTSSGYFPDKYELISNTRGKEWGSECQEIFMEIKVEDFTLSLTVNG